MLGLETRLLIKLCDDIAGSPADDGEEAINSEAGTHPLGASCDSLWLHGVLVINVLLKCSNAQSQDDVRLLAAILQLNIFDGYQGWTKLCISGVEVQMFCSFQIQTTEG